jgi:uncharacterized C2H2 Zn-finger protein
MKNYSDYVLMFSCPHCRGIFDRKVVKAAGCCPKCGAQFKNTHDYLRVGRWILDDSLEYTGIFVFKGSED